MRALWVGRCTDREDAQQAALLLGRDPDDEALITTLTSLEFATFVYRDSMGCMSMVRVDPDGFRRWLQVQQPGVAPESAMGEVLRTDDRPALPPSE